MTDRAVSELHVQSWGPEGGTPVVAVHGITANRTCWAPVAELLPDVRLTAPDLRGRGLSAELPGPWGMVRHADDVAAVITDAADRRGGGPVVLVGHSMGAFVAAVTAARHPELVSGLLLVDGGLPLHAPPGRSVAAAVQASLGPALARLDRTFPSVEAYRDFWRDHPALGPAWSPAVQAYVDADLVGTPPQLRSRVLADAVAQDSAELYDAPTINAALAEVRAVMIMLTAPRGLSGQSPGLYDDAAVQAAERLGFDVREVPDVDHYTIVLGAGAAAVAAAVRELSPRA